MASNEPTDLNQPRQLYSDGWYFIILGHVFLIVGTVIYLVVGCFSASAETTDTAMAFFGMGLSGWIVMSGMSIWKFWKAKINQERNLRLAIGIEASYNNRIEIKEKALPVFLRLLREKTIPWKFYFYTSWNIMLELDGSKFRMRPNVGMNPHATLKGIIINEGPVAVVQWQCKGLKQHFWFIFLWFGLIGLMLIFTPALLFSGITAEENELFFFFIIMSALGLAVFFGIRYKIIKDQDEMVQLLASVAAEAAAEVGKATSPPPRILVGPRLSAGVLADARLRPQGGPAGDEGAGAGKWG